MKKRWVFLAVVAPGAIAVSVLVVTALRSDAPAAETVREVSGAPSACPVFASVERKSAPPVAKPASEGCGMCEEEAHGGSEATGPHSTQTATASSPHPDNQMIQLLSVLSDLNTEARVYSYDRLFLGPDDKPATGMVKVPAKTFADKVDRIDRLAAQCASRMKKDHRVARVHYEKSRSPQLAVFLACEEGMKEISDHIADLRHSATAIQTSRQPGSAHFYLELSRLERTTAQISVLAMHCIENMRRANSLCAKFEPDTAREIQAPKEVTW